MKILSYLVAGLATVLMAYILYVMFSLPEDMTDKKFFTLLISAFAMFFLAFLFDNLGLVVYSTEMKRRRRLGIWNAILGCTTCLGVLIWILIEM